MNATNHGTPAVPFAQLFADTVATHGEAWAQRYYKRHGMQAWEFAFWRCATVRRVLSLQLAQGVAA